MPLLLSEPRFFIWDTVGGMWDRTAVLNPFWFMHLIEIFMNAESPLWKILISATLTNIQGTHGSSRSMVRTLLGENHWGTYSRDTVVLESHGYTVMEPWWSHFYFKHLLCRDNRNRFQRGIWKACSMTSRCVRFQFVPTGDPAVLFFFSPTQTCSVSLAALCLPWPYKNDRAKASWLHPGVGPHSSVSSWATLSAGRRCPFPPPGFVSLPKSLFRLVRMDSLQAHVNHSGVEASKSEREHIASECWYLQAPKLTRRLCDLHCVTGDSGRWARSPFLYQLSLLQVESCWSSRLPSSRCLVAGRRNICFVSGFS